MCQAILSANQALIVEIPSILSDIDTRTLVLNMHDIQANAELHGF